MAGQNHGKSAVRIKALKLEAEGRIIRTLARPAASLGRAFKGNLMIESTAVRYFRAVTESGSIKQAAAALRIAPSAISRQVQAIEEELVGQAVRARRARHGADRRRPPALSLRGREPQPARRHPRQGRRSSTRCAAARSRSRPSRACWRISCRISSSIWLEDYPGISISITVMGSRDVAEMVGHNDVDLGLVFGRAPRRDLIELARMRQSLCLIVSPRHPLASRDIAR